MKKIDHGKLKYQVLSILKEQSPLTQKEIVEKLANYFNLTKEEREETYSKRPHDKVFYKMVASNEERLRFAGLEDFTPQGHAITQHGLKALVENRGTIPFSYLRRFPEYRKWASEGHRKKAKESEIIEIDKLLES